MTDYTYEDMRESREDALMAERYAAAPPLWERCEDAEETLAQARLRATTSYASASDAPRDREVATALEALLECDKMRELERVLTKRS